MTVAPAWRAATQTPGAAVTAVLAMIYGAGVAFLNLGDEFKSAWLMWGAAIVGVCFVVFMVVPFVRALTRGDANRAA